MTDMKSAYERAMERADKIGKASPEELKQMEAGPAGNQIAAKYMKELGFDLATEIEKYKGSGTRKQVIEGAMEILMRYLSLPTGSLAREPINRAKQGILVLKENKKQVQGIFAQLDTLFNYYEQARQQTVTQIKQAVEQQMAQQARGTGGQMGPQGRVDATSQPQFREELTRSLQDLNRQYEQALQERKQRLLNTP
ncbi:MAG: hypothetical protein Q7T05_08980 [Dehalococcoidia bacterium]|nr:hypothetical protein [Dehalococcoidia bacterium]